MRRSFESERPNFTGSSQDQTASEKDPSSRYEQTRNKLTNNLCPRTVLVSTYAPIVKWAAVLVVVLIIVVDMPCVAYSLAQ